MKSAGLFLRWGRISKSPWLATLPALIAVGLTGAISYAQLNDTQSASGIISAVALAATSTATETSAPASFTPTRTPTETSTPTWTATPCSDLDADTLCDGADSDADGDGCLNTDEQQTLLGSERAGGRRDYLNPFDYFNPTNDRRNRIDDILRVVEQYFIDQGNSNYTAHTDRILVGQNAWNLGMPNGLQRVDDILNIVKQYFHDCA